MNISLEWLKSYISVEHSAEQLAHLLTMSGLEVEGIEAYEPIQGGLEGVVIGEVVDCQQHPNAEKLSLTRVDIGQPEPVQIVCGAPNVAKGQKVAVATVGSTIYPVSGEPIKLKRAKIRGEESFGMICAEDELGLGSSHDGIMVLSTDLPNGTPAAQYFNVSTDQVLAIGLTPNRIDAASHYGVARDLAAVLRQPVHFPDLSAFSVADRSLPISVEISDAAACRRYAGLTLSGITVAPSPEWLCHRLKAIGLSPINNVVDITNYVLHSLGQPLHAFDAAHIKGGKVVVRTAKSGEKFVTLDGTERTLTSSDLMICDAETPMCIAGVFGGLHSGISARTTTVFLESAWFSPGYIRRTSQHHQLKTDASFRFERGADPDMVIPALKLAALLITSIAGGRISSDIVDVCPEPFTKAEVLVRFRNITRLIGKQIPRPEIMDILQRLDIDVLEAGEEQMRVAVPPYRVDVTREADVIEEILRIHGYDSIEVSERLNASYLASFPKVDPNKLESQVGQMLAGAGCLEILTNSLTHHSRTEWLPTLQAEQEVKILNALSAGLDVMRQSLLFAGLEVIAYNLNRRQKNLRLFDFGKVYQKTGPGQYTERKQLAIYVTGERQEESWIQKPEKADFHVLASLVYRVMALMGIQVQTEPEHSGLFAYGLSVQAGTKAIGRMGLLPDTLLRKAEIRQEVFYAELEWEQLVALFKGHQPYQEIPKFPEVRRDLSLVMDKGVSFAQIQELALRTERKLLRGMNVFSVFEGAPLQENQKSYAVSFLLQDSQKTLEDAAIDRTMQRLMDAFEKELGVLIRK